MSLLFHLLHGTFHHGVDVGAIKLEEKIAGRPNGGRMPSARLMNTKKEA